MPFYACRCGAREAIGRPHPCNACPRCLSDLAESPDRHQAVLPHDFIGAIETGPLGPVLVARCRWCRMTREELEAVTC